MKLFPHTPKDIGKFGEDAAAQYLKKENYRLLCRNYHCRGGELDLVAVKNETVIFVEVKTRSSVMFGTPAEAVTYTKIQRMVRAAKSYLAEKQIDANIRFDVMEVYVSRTKNDIQVKEIVHIENAVTDIF